MIIPIAFVITFCVMLWFMWDEDEKIGPSAMVATMVAVFVMVICAAVREVIIHNTPREITKVEIVSIERGSQTSGNFFLGCGTIGERSYYFVYEQLKDGSMLLNKYKTDTCRVVESDEETPHAVYEHQVEREWVKFWLITARIDSYVTKIVVPKNTVTREFRL